MSDWFVYLTAVFALLIAGSLSYLNWGPYRRSAPTLIRFIGVIILCWCGTVGAIFSAVALYRLPMTVIHNLSTHEQDRPAQGAAYRHSRAA